MSLPLQKEPKSMKAATRFLALCLFALAACTGQIGPAGQSSGSVSNPAGGGGTGGGAPLTCQQPQAEALNARLLSPSQYDNTVKDILQVGGDPANGFSGSGFAQLDDSAVEQRAGAAAVVAAAAAQTLSAWSPCAPTATDTASCEQQIIDRIGSKAYRRALTPGERTELQALFDAGIKEKDFPTGVEWFLTGLLQAPDFLYLFAKPGAGEKPGQVVPIEAHDLAARLAYFIWDSTPDDALMAAAAAGQLANGDQWRAQLGRMVADPRFLRGVSSFYTVWLHLSGFADIARNDTDFTSDVANAMSTSLLMTATEVYNAPSPMLSDLLSGQTYPLNPTLQKFYNRSGAGNGFTPVVMDGEGRHGILTHPGLMALMSRPETSNPISRGLFVLRTMLCQSVPAPPTGVVIPPLPPLAPGLSTRDRLNQHAQVAFCATCHNTIDPPGFALESFDEVGRFRAMDGGKPVDTSGVIGGSTGVAGPFASGDELLAKIAGSQDVQRCFAQQYLQQALSRPVGVADQCSLQTLQTSFGASGDLKQLIGAVAGSDAFRLRMAEGVAP
jgi:hypothetical protein